MIITSNLDKSFDKLFDWVDGVLAGRIAYEVRDPGLEAKARAFELLLQYAKSPAEKERLEGAAEQYFERDSPEKAEERKELALKMLPMLLKGYSKLRVQEVAEERLEKRYGVDPDIKINISGIEPEVRRIYKGLPYLIAKVTYSREAPDTRKEENALSLYLYSKEDIWAGVEIGGYFDYNLNQVFEWIDLAVIQGNEWKAFEENAGIKEDELRPLSDKLNGYSRVAIRKLLREEIEARHGLDTNQDLLLWNNGFETFIDKEAVGVSFDFDIEVAGQKKELEFLDVWIWSKDKSEVTILSNEEKRAMGRV